jgi:hypothetical protein
MDGWGERRDLVREAGPFVGGNSFLEILGLTFARQALYHLSHYSSLLSRQLSFL